MGSVIRNVLQHRAPVSAHSSDESRLSTPLRLLRAILRECRSLPDAAARAHCTARALKRYRGHQQTGADDEQIKARTRDARDALSLLVRANDGERKPLRKILLQTYGRTGPRRHELLNRIMGPEVAPDQTLLDAMQGQGPAINPGPEHVLSPVLTALARSQMIHAPPIFSKEKIRRTTPDIPEYNTWHRPMPRVRVKNMKKRFLQDVLRKILPPLPPKEWLRLRDLASGTLKEPRVALARHRHAPAETWVAKDEFPKFRTEALLLGIDSEEGLRGRHKGRPHHITARFMRRLWAEVFYQCPVMQWDGTVNSWQVEWGMADHGSKVLRDSSGGEQALFERADEQARSLAASCSIEKRKKVDREEHKEDQEHRLQGSVVLG